MEITPCVDRVPQCDGDILENDSLCIPHKISTIESFVRNKTLTIKLQTKSTFCTFENCTNKARYKGKLCSRHSITQKCSFGGCDKSRQGRYYCKAHGGSHKNSKCKIDGCTKFNQGGGHCYKHGGCKRCVVENCTHRAISANCKVCTFHLKNVQTTKLLELL